MRAAEHWRLQGLNKLEIRLNFLPQFHELCFLSLRSRPGMLGWRGQLRHRGCHLLSDELGGLKAPSGSSSAVRPPLAKDFNGLWVNMRHQLFLTQQNHPCKTGLGSTSCNQRSESRSPRCTPVRCSCKSRQHLAASWGAASWGAAGRGAAGRGAAEAQGEVGALNPRLCSWTEGTSWLHCSHPFEGHLTERKGSCCLPQPLRKPPPQQQRARAPGPPRSAPSRQAAAFRLTPLPQNPTQPLPAAWPHRFLPSSGNRNQQAQTRPRSDTPGLTLMGERRQTLPAGRVGVRAGSSPALADGAGLSCRDKVLVQISPWARSSRWACISLC